MDKNESCKIIRQAIDIEIDALIKLKESFDISSILKAIDMINECRSKKGRVVTMGAGNSSIIARKVAHNLYCIEIGAFFLSSEEGLHGGLGLLQENDLVIAFSKGGKTREMIESVPAIKHKKVKMIAVTENINTEFAEAADLVLVVKVDREVDADNMIATASSAAMVTLFDAIMALMMKQQGFKPDNFVVIHPGGAVGEMLKRKNPN